MVLLHMIEAPRPVERALYDIGLQRLREQMPDEVLFFLNTDHGNLIQAPGVGWLPAAFWVERALIQGNSGMSVALAACDNVRAEMLEIGVSKVEVLSKHRGLFIW